LKRIVVLTGRSLLVEGLLSRLRGYARQFELRVVDLAAPDFQKQVSEFRPEIIIFYEGDVKDSLPHSLVDFLNSMPEAILLELRLDNPNVQVIQSVRFSASNTEELVQLFRTDSRLPAAAGIS
jgi:hypothetical protein